MRFGHSSNVMVVILAAAALLLGFLMTYGADLTSLGWFDTDPTEAPLAVPEGTVRAGWESGGQLVLMFFVAASCGWCQDTALPSHLGLVKSALGGYATEHGLRFVSIGVALDSDVHDGLALLNRFGEFDQVSSGLSWANQTAIGLLDLGLPPATELPQVIVYYRRLETGNNVPRAYDHELLMLKKGLSEINAWVASGVPMPTLPGTIPSIR